MRLLMIEDGASSAGMLAEKLAGDGFRLRRCRWSDYGGFGSSLEDAAAIVLTLGGPTPEAARMVQIVRARGFDQPLLAISTQCDWRERVATLDAGADDFIVMPYRSEEVAARLRALIRRSAGAAGGRIRFGDFECDLKAHRIWLNQEPLDLTRNEQRLLQGFLLKSDFVLSRGQIGHMLYVDNAQQRSGNAVEVYISRLRRKISPHRIRTIRGLGYHLRINEHQEA